MLSTLEIRHLVETSFLPIRCECAFDTGAAMTVRFYQDTLNHEVLVVTGISMTRLRDGQSLRGLIEGLRQDLELVSSTPLHRGND